MSRTDKNRPEWVRENDFTLEMVYFHNHLDFGKIERLDYYPPNYQVQYKYNFCTAVTRRLRPSIPGSNIYMTALDGKIHCFSNPCTRWDIRRNNTKWLYGMRYPGRIIRAKERDFNRVLNEGLMQT